MIGKRTKTVLAVAIIYLIVACSVLAWLTLGVRDAGSTMKEQVSVIADAVAQEHVFIELQALVESSQVTREELNEFILTEDETIDFLSEVETIGWEQGLILETTSLQVVESKDSFDTLLVSFAMEGEEDKLNKMIKILETLPYHSELRSLKLDFVDEGVGSSLSVTLAVTLNQV